MEVARTSCRLCLTETDFNVSLFGNYCRKTNMLDKILVCLRMPIEHNETLSTICHRCAEKVENYYDFINFIKKAQTKVPNRDRFSCERPASMKVKHEPNLNINKRQVTYVREQVIDADYTFSFLDFEDEEKDEPKPKASSPFFSYFSPPNQQKLLKDSLAKDAPNCIWKTPQQKVKKSYDSHKIDSPKRGSEKFKQPSQSSRRHSRDLFESQSQDVEDLDSKAFDWRLSPEDNIMKRVRQKCFGQKEF